MSSVAGAVVVLDEGRTREDVERALGDWLGGVHAGPDGAWDPPGLSDARLILERHPMGYDLLILRFSANARARDRDAVDARIDALFRQAAERLGARFGYLADYASMLDDPWLEDEVLVPLAGEDWEALQGRLYARMLLGPGLPMESRGTVAASGPWGTLVALD